MKVKQLEITFFLCSVVYDGVCMYVECMFRSHFGSGVSLSRFCPIVVPMDESLLCSEVIRSQGQSRSGAEKRRDKNSLPKVFFLLDRRTYSVLGAAVFLEASRARTSDQLSWSLTRCVPLRVPFVVGVADRRYTSTVFPLWAGCEARVRESVALVGGHLGSHFPEMGDQPVRCFAIPEQFVPRLFSDPSAVVVVKTPSSYALTAGVKPALVEDDLSDLRASAPQQVDVPVASAVGVGGDADLGDPTARPAERLSAGVAKQLKGLYVEQQGTCAVTHRYTVSGILSCLQLASNLKPTASVKDALAACAPILMGAEGDSVAGDLRGDKYHLPSVKMLRAARLRLDYMHMIFEQKLFLRCDARHYQLMDSSPQLGFNFLCTIVDTIYIPAAHAVNIHLRVAADLNDHWSSESAPLSSLGVGKSSLVKKSMNSLHLTLMTVACDQDFHVKRNRYRGTCSDQGTEKGINDISLSVIPRFADLHPPGSTQSYAYPRSLYVPGALHILYDALEVCVKASPLYDGFIDVLKIIQQFLNDKHYVRKYRSMFLSNDSASDKVFSTGQKVHIDWRWEFLSLALDALLPKYKILKSNYVQRQLEATDAGGILRKSILRDLTRALEVEHWTVAAELYRMMGKVVEKTAKELEVCDCHHDIWHTGLGRKRRRSAMIAAVGAAPCVWQGRRLAWFIAVGMDELFQSLQHVTSDELQRLISEIPAKPRAVLVASMEKLRAGMIETLRAKFDFLLHCPYSAIGAFYCTQGGSVSNAQLLLQGCIQEYDQAIAGGRGDLLHRVAKLLFSVGCEPRTSFEAFIAAGPTAELSAYPRAYIALMEYALIPFVERRIEAEHAKIKSIGARRFSISLPYVCALMREQRHLDLLRRSPQFTELCHQSWHSRNLVEDVIRLRFSTAELRRMSATEKIKAIYQTGMSQEYADTSASVAHHQNWLALTDASRSRPQVLSGDGTLCVSYLKDVLFQDHFFSLPTELFELCVQPGDVPVAVDCVSAVLGVVGLDAPVLHGFFQSECTLIKVINTSPELRQCTISHHIERRRATIKVSVCEVMCRDPLEKRLMVKHDIGSLHELDLRFLLPRMAEVN